MTFTISIENLYFIVCIILLLLQVYQYSIINKLKKDVNTIYQQLAAMIVKDLADKGIIGINPKKNDDTSIGS